MQKLRRLQCQAGTANTAAQHSTPSQASTQVQDPEDRHVLFIICGESDHFSFLCSSSCPEP
jgi:hypothetical protein